MASAGPKLKTQTFGIVKGCQKKQYFGGVPINPIPNYRLNRENGTDEDSPKWKFPADGTTTWIKGRLDRGCYVYGHSDGDKCYKYEVRYDEGKLDKKWMEEKDSNYIGRTVLKISLTATAVSTATTSSVIMSQVGSMAAVKTTISTQPTFASTTSIPILGGVVPPQPLVTVAIPQPSYSQSSGSRASSILTSITASKMPMASSIVSMASPSVVAASTAADTSMIIKPNVLGMPSSILARECIIGNMAMNSAGDIYHTLAYFALSTNNRHEIPTLLLAYDVDKIKEYYEISVKFMSAFGYGKSVKLEYIFEGGYRKDIRQSAIQDAARISGVPYYVDQRLLTSIISYYAWKNGAEVTAGKIRNELKARWQLQVNQARRVELLPNAIVQEIEAYGKTELERMNVYLQSESVGSVSKIEKRPLIIFHVRRARDKTNADLDFDNNVYQKMAAYLKESFGYCVWYILAHDNSSSAMADKNLSAPFLYRLTSSSEDYGKLLHFKLLMNLYDQKDLFNLRGVIGNTSGTLDLAGFIGLRIFNLHHLVMAMDYQTLRILIQSTFMTICMFNSAIIPYSFDKLSKRDINLIAPNLHSWLNGDSPVPNMGELNRKIDDDKSGFRDLLYFTLWKKPSDETVALPGAETVKTKKRATSKFNNYFFQRIKNDFAHEVKDFVLQREDFKPS